VSKSGNEVLRNRILQLKRFVGQTFPRGARIKMTLPLNSSVFHLATSTAFVGIIFCTFGCRDRGTIQQNGKETPTEATSVTANESYVKRLTADGWDNRAAESVVRLNAEWFAIQADENSAGFEIQLKLLGGLGKHSDIQAFLADYPETAGLLAAAADPQLVADTLRTAANNGEYDRIAGLYVQNAAPRDAADVAEALQANYDLICALNRRGLLGCDVMFVFDRDGLEASEYEAWLREAISARVAASDDELAGFANLIMRHGSSIRERMRADDEFRLRFRGDLWPKLARVVESEQGAFEQYLDEPRIWNLLALDNGEELLRRCGLLPIDLLFGYLEIDHPPYPESLHKKIIQILLRREELVIHSLMKFRSEPQFHKLLQRDLSPDTRSAALAHLFKAGANYPEKLALYERLNDTALAEEVGPPPSGIITWVPFYYTLYEVPKKRLQGREPTGMELFSAAADPVFLVVDIFTFGQGAAGRKVLLAGGKEAAERAATEIAEKGAEKVFVTTLRDTGLELAKNRIGKEVAEKMSEKELVTWSVSGTLSQMQQAVKSTVGKATTFEITKPVQFMFGYSGVGRETWKRWTGMEARLFMRGDAKVFVRLENAPVAVIGTRSAAFLNRTAQDLSIGAVAESEPGQKALHSGVKQVLSAKDQLHTWQQHVSAWWLFNASTIDQNVGPAERERTPTEGSK
jgi:hypothetical protein